MGAQARTLRAIAAGLSVLCAGVFVARLPNLGPWTLGLLSARLSGVVIVGAAATAIGVLLWRRPGGALGSAAVLILTYALDADVTRRRSAVLALLCLGIPWALHALFDLGKERTLPWLACIVLASAGASTLVASDHLPYRTSLPPIDAAAPPPGAPHIVLISLDTTRYDALFGQDEMGHAPNVERFAKTALRFPHTVAEASHTHPSMGSLLTSRMPIEHGSISTSPVIHPSIPTLAAHLRRSGYRTAGFLENPWLGPDFGLSEGYEYLHKKAERSRIDTWLEKDKARPTFLHVHLFEPHGPYELRERFLPRGSSEKSDDGRNAWSMDWVKSRAALGDTIPALFIRNAENKGAHNLSPRDFAWLWRIYMTEVFAMDEWIGEFIEHAESALGDNTIFVITADHGEEFGDHGALHHGHTLYGELVNVPLLVRIPGVAAEERTTPAGLVDVAPTLLDAAQLPPLPNAAGRSLLAEDRPDSPLVSTRFFQAGQHLFAIRSGEWKLHMRLFGGLDLNDQPIDFASEAIPPSIELYRWGTDPHEQENVASEHADIVRKLQGELREWHAATLERSSKDKAGGTAKQPSQSTYDDLRSLGYSGTEPDAK